MFIQEFMNRSGTMAAVNGVGMVFLPKNENLSC